MPGSVDGVNPAYHKRIFANPTIARAYGFVDTQHGRGCPRAGEPMMVRLHWEVPGPRPGTSQRFDPR
jgi:hypothetical protein